MLGDDSRRQRDKKPERSVTALVKMLVCFMVATVAASRSIIRCFNRMLQRDNSDTNIRADDAIALLFLPMRYLDCDVKRHPWSRCVRSL